MLPVIEGADNIIFLSEIYSASAMQGDIAKMGDTICDTIHERGGKFIVMSVNLPYDVARFQDADAIMIAYLAISMPVDPEDKIKEMQKYGANMPAALYMMFSKEDAPTAKLPIDIPQLDESSAETSTESSAKNDVSDVSNSTSDNVSFDTSAQSVPNTDNTPKTGDNNNSVILTAIPALCLSLFAVIYSWKRKKDTDEI